MVGRFLSFEMCYVLHDNGRVRYYPDDEFYKSVKTTLVILSKPQYSDILKLFNEVLDNFYENRNKESPVHAFFACLETFALSLINDNRFNRLNDSSVDTLMNKIEGCVNADPSYAKHNKEAASCMRGIFLKWIGMCHKYRHGKPHQINNDVPPELFNFIFTLGVSTFRFLLEINDKYAIKG